MTGEDKQIGTVRIDHEVLGSIAGIAAKGVPGVWRITTSLVGGLTHLIRGNPDAGIKVVVAEGEVSFDLGITVEYGVNIPEVTYQVQSAIKEEVEKMSGLKVATVNVVVHGVHVPGKSKDDGSEGPGRPDAGADAAEDEAPVLPDLQ